MSDTYKKKRENKNENEGFKIMGGIVGYCEWDGKK